MASGLRRLVALENHISALYYSSEHLYGEFNMYADADSIVIIDPRLLKDVEAALEVKKIDYMNLPIPDGYTLFELLCLCGNV